MYVCMYIQRERDRQRERVRGSGGREREGGKEGGREREGEGGREGERARESERERDQGLIAFVRKPCNIIEKALILQFRDLLAILELVTQHRYFESQHLLIFFPSPAA
jgi:hypothetical protein